MSEGYGRPWWAQEARSQWILLRPCGCAEGVLEGSEAANEDDAWAQFYDTPWIRQEAHKKGVRIIEVDHEVYVERYFKQMKPGWVCPHKTKLGFWRRLRDALGIKW